MAEEVKTETNLFRMRARRRIEEDIMEPAYMHAEFLGGGNIEVEAYGNAADECLIANQIVLSAFHKALEDSKGYKEIPHTDIIFGLTVNILEILVASLWHCIKYQYAEEEKARAVLIEAMLHVLSELAPKEEKKRKRRM